MPRTQNFFPEFHLRCGKVIHRRLRGGLGGSPRRRMNNFGDRIRTEKKKERARGKGKRILTTETQRSQRENEANIILLKMKSFETLHYEERRRDLPRISQRTRIKDQEQEQPARRDGRHLPARREGRYLRFDKFASLRHRAAKPQSKAKS